MKKDLKEDMQDRAEIKRQKKEVGNSKDEMAQWNFGKGLKNSRDDNKNVQDKL